MILLLVLLSVSLATVFGDTPANCSYNEILGTWTFHEGERGHTDDIKCKDSKIETMTHLRKIELKHPDIAVDLSSRNTGNWTLVYNQGFEVDIGFRRYFAFSKYQKYPKTNKTISFCSDTLPGWSHDTYARDWACFIGKKDGAEIKKIDADTPDASSNVGKMERLTKAVELAFKVNSEQNDWLATVYPELLFKDDHEMLAVRGGAKSRIPARPKSLKADEQTTIDVGNLPDNFDWRNAQGQDFVSPVRNQGSCGSCFAFASMAMLESRYRIGSNNTQKPIFSPGDVVSCCPYSQGML